MKWLADPVAAFLRRLLPALFFLSFLLPARGQALVNAPEQYAVNRAAVVMVRTEVSATVYVRQVTLNNNALNHLLDSIQQLEHDSIFLSPGQKLDIVLQAFSARASHYFKSFLSYYRHDQKVTASGTGFIFSNDGYVLTNCHVVNENDDYIKRRFILSAFNYVTESNISAIESAWAVKFTEDQRNSLYKTFADVYSTLVPIVLQNLRKTVSVIMSGEDSLGEPLMRTLPASIVIKGESMPGKDVAILKVSNGHEFPVIPLSIGDPDRVGEDVLVYGYPDPVSRNSFLSKETMLVPTLTRGIISAWKRSVEGWPVIQMDAIINHGNSGGPVCDAHGKVIGITTFGSLDGGSALLAPGLNFAIPSAVLMEFVRKAGIQPRSSRLTDMFTRALLLYDQGEYRKSKKVFLAILEKDPAYPGIRGYLVNADKHIARGEDNHSDILNYASLLLILLGSFSFFIFLWRNRSAR